MSYRRDDCTACSRGATKLCSYRGSAIFQSYGPTQLCSKRDRAVLTHLPRPRLRRQQARVSFRARPRQRLIAPGIPSYGRILVPRFTTSPAIEVTATRKRVRTCARERPPCRASVPRRPRSDRALDRTQILACTQTRGQKYETQEIITRDAS
jgi:hypothetical protein